MVWHDGRVRDAADTCLRLRPTGITPCPGSSLRFLSSPIYIKLGMLSKTGPDPEQGAVPEGTGN